MSKSAFDRTNRAVEFENQNPLLFNKVDLERDKVYLIIQQTNGLEYWMTKYYANPVKTNTNFSWSIGTPVYEGDIWTLKITASEWSKMLIDEGYNYVYIENVNDMFISEFGQLFDKSADIGNKKLYKVEQAGSRIILKEVT